MKKLEQKSHRNVCYLCFKSKKTCYCDAINRIESQIHFVILQHPKERRKAIGTARMAHLSLKNSSLFVGESFLNHEEINSIISDPYSDCFLLFPHPHAIQLSSEYADFQKNYLKKTQRKIFIFIADGTWFLAKKLIRLSPNIDALKKISFNPTQKSQYLIRKQPYEYGVSSIEAICEVIRLVEPNVDPTGLMSLFKTMVSSQLKFQMENHAK